METQLVAIKAELKQQEHHSGPLVTEFEEHFDLLDESQSFSSNAARKHFYLV